MLCTLHAFHLATWLALLDSLDPRASCRSAFGILSLDCPTIQNFFFSDGWTMNDLIYRWNENSPVQMVANLSLPGGFKLDNFGSVNCDVITATGKTIYPFTKGVNERS